MNADATSALLRDWFATELAEADDVRVEGLDRVELGHSAETILLTLAWSAGDDQHRRNVVLRVRPPEPGLLEPYDLEQQFRILRALEPTPVKSPKVLWHEGTGDVLGRPFYVMERVGGTVYERTVPGALAGAPERLRRMSQSLVENLAAIHVVDVQAAGLGFLGDGSGFLPDRHAGARRRQARELRVRARRGHRGVRLGDDVRRRSADRPRVGGVQLDDTRLVHLAPGVDDGR